MSQEQHNIRTGVTPETLVQAILDSLYYLQGRPPDLATTNDWYMALAFAASLMAPLEQLFASLFFVLLGFQVDVTTFADLRVLVLGLLLALVAIFGKMASTLILKKGYHRLVVGFGLVPRGEVTLIFASLGKSMGVLSTSLYSVLIIVVLFTTLNHAALPDLGLGTG